MFQILTTVLFTVALGFSFSRRQIFEAKHLEAFELFLFRIAIPCALFQATLRYPWQELVYWPYIVSYLSCFIIIAGLIFIRFRQESPASILVKALAGGYVNAAIYTLPVITLLTQDPRAAVLGNLIQVVVIQTTLITVLNFLQNKHQRLTRRLLNTVSTPLIALPLIGLIINYWQLPLPITVMQVVASLGSGAGGLALFTFGLNLGSIRFDRAILGNELWFLSLTKTIIHPLLALIVGKYIFGLSGYWLYALIIACAAPTAFVVHLIAKQFETNVDQTKLVITMTSVISLMILPIIVLLKSILEA